MNEKYERLQDRNKELVKTLVEAISVLKVLTYEIEHRIPLHPDVATALDNDVKRFTEIAKRDG